MLFEMFNGPEVVLQEIALQKEVFGRISAYGKFRECENVGVLTGRMIDKTDNFCQICRKIANSCVYLCLSDPDKSHLGILLRGFVLEVSMNG